MNKELKPFLLAIQCMTYNQSAYITDALNGFVMQQTSFPFIAVVVDDASADGEQDVIKSYLEEHFNLSEETGYKQWETEDACWTFARHKENENCHIVVVYLKKNLFKKPDKKNEVVKDWMQSKYIAFCEGDDYWTDPLKLQKQVDFLEAHPDFSMCCHRYKLYYQDESKWDNDYVEDLFERNPAGFVFGHKETVRRLISHTATVVYRTAFYDANCIYGYKYGIDFHVVYHLLLKGPGYYFPFVGSVYRKQSKGVYSSLKAQQSDDLCDETYLELLEKHPEDIELRESYEKEIRFILNHHDCSTRTRRIARLCARSYRQTDGFLGVVKMAMKMTKSYFNGFKSTAKNK